MTPNPNVLYELEDTTCGLHTVQPRVGDPETYCAANYPGYTRVVFDDATFHDGFIRFRFPECKAGAAVVVTAASLSRDGVITRVSPVQVLTVTEGMTPHIDWLLG